MNAFALSGLLTGITCTGLILLILRHGKEKIHRIWIFFILAIAVWGWGAFAVGYATTEAMALISWRIAWIGGAFTAFIFFHFVNLFCGLKQTKKVILVYVWGLFIATVVLFSRRYIGDLEFTFNSFYVFTPGSKLYHVSIVIWIIIIINSLYKLFKFYNISEDKEKRNQTLYLLIASAIAYIGGISDSLLPLCRNIYPYRNFFVPIYCLIVTYAILKHHLMDISIVFKKGVVYSILVAVITAVYLLFVVTISRIFQELVGYKSYIVNLVAVFIIAVLFNPLRNKIQTFLDKLLFKGTLETLAREREFFHQEMQKQDQLKAIAHFASGLAHEIKNPLTALKAFGEYLPRKHNDPEFISKFCEIINKEVDRINNLAHQLLDFAKPAKADLKPTDIQQVLSETLEFLSNEFSKHKIEVVREYTLPNDIKISGDSTQLKQVFLNLFLNAMDAMPDGGIITIATELTNEFNADKRKLLRRSNEVGVPNETSGHADGRRLIDDENLRESALNKSVLICIKDTGHGIPKENLKNLFNPFFTTKEKGTGLGLSIVQNIIKEHRGEIKVESKVGEGTKFIIELPTYHEQA